MEYESMELYTEPCDKRIREAVKARELHLLQWFNSRLADIGYKLAYGEYDMYLEKQP